MLFIVKELMIKHDTLSKILLSIMLLGFALWFGGSIARTAIGYDLFKPEAVLSLKETYTNIQQMQNIYLFANLAIYTDFGYVAFVLALIIYWFKQKHVAKENGWLVMALILCLIALPVQSYLIYIDYRLANSIIFHNVRDFYDWEIQEFFYNRFVSNSWTVASSLSFLCTATSALCFAWLPLRKGEQYDN